MYTLEDIVRILTVNQTLLAAVLVKLGMSNKDVNEIIDSIYETYDKNNEEEG